MPWCAAFVEPAALRGQGSLHCTATCHAVGRERLRVEHADATMKGQGNQRERDAREEGDSGLGRAEPWDPLGLLQRYWTRATTRYGFSRRYGMVLGARELLMERLLGGFVLATGAAMCLAERWR
jgi:hypothetical protein